MLDLKRNYSFHEINSNTEEEQNIKLNDIKHLVLIEKQETEDTETVADNKQNQKIRIQQLI